MNGNRTNSPKSRGVHAGLCASFVGALLLALALASGHAADAQGGVKGKVIHSGSKPFRETMRQMRLRDAEIRRKIRVGLLPHPRPAARPPHEHEIELDLGEPPLDGRTFPAPGYRQAGSAPGGSQAPQTVGSNQDGVTLDDEWNTLFSASIPPDTMGAVGPSHFVVMINGAVAIYNKSNGARVSLVDLDTFFTIGGVAPEGGSFDPRITYDRQSGRWFACVLELGNGSTNNELDLAVSATSDPTGAWDKYAFTAGSGSGWADYETLGVDANGVYFGVTIFPASGAHAKIMATPKSSLTAASPSLGTVTAVDDIADMYSTPQPAVNLDGSAGGRAYYISASNSTFSNVRYRTVTWSGGAPSFSGTNTLTTPSFGQPANFTPSGSTMPLEVGDMRLMMAYIRNNQLWTARHVRMNSSGGSSGPDRMGCEWLTLDVSTATATLADSGRVYDSGATPRHYIYPSIAVNGQGHAAMGFSGAKTTEFVGAYTCGRLSTDAASTMQSIDLLKAGEAAYTMDFSSGRNRWGDYSYTTVDPSDDMTMWTIQEYADATGSDIGGSTSRWATRIAKLLSPAPTLTNPNTTANQGDNDKVVSLSGTGFFDPGASFPNRLDVIISGDGISGKTVTWTNAATASVTFDVAANATTGARDITLTNPDGQSVTVVGGLTINASGMPAPTALTATPATSTRVNLAWTDNSSDELGFKLERRLGMGAYSEIKTVGANVTATSDTTVSPNSTYTYRVYAYKTGVTSAYSNEDDATTPPLPTAPSNLNATAITSTRIDLTWTDNSSDEQGFKIERKTGTGSFAQVKSLGANATSWSNAALTPNTDYTYRIRSYNANGESAYSNEDPASTPPLPASPSNLSATAFSSTRVDLAWTDNSSDEQGFKIERKTGTGSFALIKTLGPNKSSWINNTSVTPNTSYTYRIRAYNTNGDSAYSNEAPVTTPPLPAAPSGLTATAITSNRIDLTWTDNSSDEQGFKIERKTGTGSFALVKTTGANANSWSNLSLLPDTSYSYRVRSYNTNGDSDYSNVATAATPPLPAAPTSLVAAAVSSSRIDLSWVDNASDETGFRIERKTGTGAFALLASRGANVTSFSNTGLTANTTYTYRVRAYNANGNSNYSNEDGKTTPAGPTHAASSAQRSQRGGAARAAVRHRASFQRRP